MLIISFLILAALIFAVMVFSLRKIFSQNITSATSHLEKIASDYATKEEEIKKQYEEASHKSQEIIVNTQKDLQAQKEQMAKETQDQKQKILDAAQSKADEMLKQAEASCQMLLKEMNRKIDERALLKAEELLKTVLPEGLRQEIHKKWIEELLAGGVTQLDRLKIPDDSVTAFIITPYALDTKQRNSLQETVSQKLGRQITLVEKIDPSTVAGLTITVGNLVFDGSLRFKIQEEVRAQQSSL